jgi:hypothetical protein
VALHAARATRKRNRLLAVQLAALATRSNPLQK